MSGDVQPRKRKDKRRKKEGESLGNINDLLNEKEEKEEIHVSSHHGSNDKTENIHVHHDHGIGGNLCVKIIFFALLAVLLGLVGLIFIESRGSTDVDLPSIEDSRFAEYFTGFLDDTPDDHGHDDHAVASEETDDDHGDHDEDEHNPSEEAETDDHDEEHSEQEESEPAATEEEEEEEEEEDGVESQEKDEPEDDSEDENTAEEEFDESDEETEIETEEEEEEDSEEDYDLTQEDESEETTTEPARKSSKPVQESEPEEEETEEEIIDEDSETAEEEEISEEEEEDSKPALVSEEEIEEIEESEEALKEEEEAIKKEKINLLEDDDEDISDISDVILRRKKEKELMRKLEKLLKEKKIIENEDEEQEREENEETSGVALKLGVGVALVVVAHLVVVRRWRQLTHATEETVAESTTDEPVVSPVPETTEISNDILEEDVVHEPIKRRTSMDVKLERQDPEKYYTKEELGDSEDLDEEELGEEEEYLEEEEIEEEEDYELEPSPPPSDLSEPEDEELEEEEEEDEPPVAPPRRGPQGVEDEIENEQFVKAEPVELDDGDSLEANKDSAEPKAAEEEDDWFFRQELDFADAHFHNKPQVALDTYDKILKKSPMLLRALVGRARALDQLADTKKSNIILGQAIEAYYVLITENADRLNDEKFREIAERCVDRMRFAGRNVNAAVVQQALINRFPNEVGLRNAKAVSYLLGGQLKHAKKVLEETLERWPHDGVALVHLGFIYKTSLGLLEKGAELMERGILTNESGTMDGRFLFHLGDALHRIGKGDEALKWYDLGVKNKIFKSKYQRSLYNVDRLKASPWWSIESTGYAEFFKNLEKNWEKIREEGMTLLKARDKALFQDEAESLKDTGDWKQLDLYSRGRKQPGCARAPFTCQLISAFAPASTCTRGQAKFSVMEPGTHVWPHCGPTNCRLRAHLGLVVPNGVYIRVADQTKSWQNGKILIFDDSFEHEVWHNGTSVRLVLIIDVWHPELTIKERQTLSPI